MCHMSCRTSHDGFALFFFQSSSESELRSSWYCDRVSSSSARFDSFLRHAGAVAGSLAGAGSVSVMGVVLQPATDVTRWPNAARARCLRFRLGLLCYILEEQRLARSLTHAAPPRPRSTPRPPPTPPSSRPARPL